MKKIRTYYNLIKCLLNKRAKLLMLVSMIIILIISFISPVISYLYAEMINNISKKLDDVNIISLIIFYVLVQLLLEIIEYIQSYIKQLISFEIERDISNQINQKLSKIKLEYLEIPNTYDMISRSSENIKGSITNSFQTLLSIYSPLIITISFTISLIAIKWYFPFLIILFNIPYLIVLLRNNIKSHNVDIEIKKNQRLINHFLEILTTRKYSKDIRTYNAIPFFLNKLINTKNIVYKSKILLAKKTSLDILWAEFIKNIAIMFCLITTVYLVIFKNAEIGVFILMYTIGTQIQSSLTEFINNISSINNLVINLDDWHKLMNFSDEKNKNNNIRELDIGQIIFENVNFSYSNCPDKKILNNINITIKANEKVAIIGKNGSGKSTFIYLLLGIFTPSSGEICIDNNKIGDVLNSYRKRTTCIFQNFIQYQMSLKDNLSSNNNGVFAKNSSLSFIDEIVFKNGKEVLLGHLDKNAQELSGGEWQRVALQRAINRYKFNLLVMDEPTANLDPFVSSKLVNSIKNKFENKTVIAITHDLSFALEFDRVLVFDKGRIVADDRPENLLKNNTIFKSIMLKENRKDKL